MQKKFLLAICMMVNLTLLIGTGCSRHDHFIVKSYSSKDDVIESVHIDVANREIEIGASDDNQIHIDYFDNEKEYLDIQVSENHELIIKLSRVKKWTDFIATKAPKAYRRINIQLPNYIISTLSIQTTNESIRVNALAVANSVCLLSNGGNIEVNQISVGQTLDLSTKNGNITGTILGGWDDFSISCSIKKGDCNLPLEKKEGAKGLKVKCNHGNIKLDFKSE
ncbi:MAG: DUF4097 domain-containing protein [Prevotella sp.]|nr:DUF4097 domain-containing protein [Staphylococcus sp.]MCM1350062.1 DUF4097 domain-containing protein [Prevotella sp.]